MAEPEGDDRMRLSDEKPVEEIVADAAEEIRKRDERIGQLEKEVSEYQYRLQQVSSNKEPKKEKVEDKKNKKEALRVLAEVALVLICVFGLAGGMWGISGYIQSHNETMAKVEAAAQKPPLTFAELACLEGAEVTDEWPDHQVIEVKDFYGTALVHVDEVTFEYLISRHRGCSGTCCPNKKIERLLNADKLANCIKKIQQQQKIRIFLRERALHNNKIRTERVEY